MVIIYPYVGSIESFQNLTNFHKKRKISAATLCLWDKEGVQQVKDIGTCPGSL